MSITIDLAGATAWVTGGASGIGAEIVTTLAAAGARVVSLDRLYPKSDAAHRPQPGVTHVHVDLGDLQSIERVAQELADSGFEPSILVNNAGVTRDGAMWNLTDEQWTAVIDVNLTAAFRLTRRVVPAMRERHAGAIVNMASVNGIRGKFGQANYAASKGGLIAFTKALARELGPRGIRVNAIAPGMIDTPMTGGLTDDVRQQAKSESALGRLGHPSDIANAVLFLVSPLAAHVTGHVLVVDGGQIA
jgi:acetoacetyl-CoA reductase/3-oxoacyl-[acyl-carrier protein] reductase